MSGFKPVKTDATDSFFRAFKADAGVAADDYAVCAFGDSAEMADELLDLVLIGIKRATASLARDYGEGREPLPAVGDHVVVVDGRNKPRCVWRTTDIDVKPLSAVDDAFAHDEGEG
ncbi:MAG: ASCH domain-containing protein, partial [Bauldia sp.]